MALSYVSILRSVPEALAQPKWKDAMVEETKALEKNNTWEFADLPTGIHS